MNTLTGIYLNGVGVVDQRHHLTDQEVALAVEQLIAVLGERERFFGIH